MPRKMLKPTRIEQSTYDAALERTHHLYDLYDDVIVSFSGGKDSTCVLNIAVTVAEERDRLPVRAIFFDEEAIPYETEHYVRRVAADPRVAVEWYCLPVEHRNACATDSSFWYPWAPEDEDLWVRPLPPEAITAADVPGFNVEPPERRWSIPAAAGLFADPSRRSVMVLGIRAAESLIRQRAVVSRTKDNYIIPFQRADTPSLPPGVNLDKAYPVYDWSTRDVWTAPRELGWDYNAAYDLMEMAGITHHNQRCAPPYGEEPRQALWMFAVCFPDVWDRIAARVPGAATAARYAQTDLYSFGATPPKPADQGWEAHVVDLATRHSGDAANATLYGLRKLLVRHYRKTSEPILPHQKHPDSGVSWEFLATCAARGNLKARRQAHLYQGAEYEKARALYDAERAAIEAQLGFALTPENSGKVT